MPPTASIVLAVNTTTLASGLRRAAGIVGSFGKDLAGSTFGLMNKGAGALAHEMGRTVLRDITHRGFDALVNQGKEIYEFSDKLTRFGIAARIGGDELLGVGSAMRQASADTGVNANEVLRGARAYVDLAGAAAYNTDKMRLLARASQASGADINDMATVVYALQHSMNIPDSQLENTIGGLINLSKDGAVHFNQMAQEMVALAPVYAQFGITGRQGAIELAAQLEVVRTGFGSASEAGTGLLRLYRALPQHAKLFDKAGVEIFKPGSRKDLLTLGQILQNIKNSSLDKDRPALIKAFGRGEAERSYQLLDKLLNEYDKLEEAGHRNGVVQQDLATYTASAAGRVAIAMARVHQSVAEAMTPDVINAFASAIEAAGKATQGIVYGFQALTELGHAISGASAKDDETTQAKAARMNERKTYLAARYEHDFHQKHPKVDMTDPDFIEMRDEAVKVELGREQTIEDRIRDQIAGRKIERTKTIPIEGPLQEGQTERPVLRKQAGAYTAEELRALLVVTKDSSNSKQIAQLIDQAIKKQTDSITKLVSMVTQFIPKLPSAAQVVIDGNPVARAGGNASDRRRK